MATLSRAKWAIGVDQFGEIRLLEWTYEKRSQAEQAIMTFEAEQIRAKTPVARYFIFRLDRR